MDFTEIEFRFSRGSQNAQRKTSLPINGREAFSRFYVPGAIRTPDRRLRRALLYPAELLGHCFEMKCIFSLLGSG